MVVLVLPPIDREALEDVTYHDAEHVVNIAVHEHLVVEKVMSQPAALLPEQRHQEGGDEKDRPKAGEHNHRNGERANGKIAKDLERIVQLARVEQTQGPDLLSHLNDILDILAIDAGEWRVCGIFQDADGEGGKEFPGICRCVEAGEDVCGVKPRSGKDDVAAGVPLGKVGHVVYAALDGDPSVFGGIVRRQLAP